MSLARRTLRPACDSLLPGPSRSWVDHPYNPKHGALMYCLIISPHESSTGSWRLELFDDMETAKRSAKARDLTKEHWIVSIEEIVRLLREDFDRERPDD